MSIDRIDYLLRKYHTSKITAVEREELSSLLEELPADVLIVVFQEFMEAHLEHSDRALDMGDVERDIRAILNVDRGLRMRWISVVASIAAMLVLALIGYWMFVPDPGGSDRVEVVRDKGKEDLQPGGEGAILTLSDGTKVVLDSLGNSAVIQNTDGVRIQVVDGQIIYRDIDEGISTKPLLNTMATPKGRRHQIVLSDGTRVWLNAESNITYPVVFTAEERRVSVSGEAYFEVARQHDNKPFMVEVSDTQTSIRVLGTKFNVNAYRDQDDIKTTLLEGKVEVAHRTLHKTLAPGQQAITNVEKENVRVNNHVDVNSVMAWRENRFSFDDTPLYIVMKELSRWYGFETIYQGEIPTYRYSGKIDKNLTFRQVIGLLGATNIQYEINSDKQVTIINN